MTTLIKDISTKSVARTKSTKVFTTGLALFAMFFGAGNMIFPLYLGANAGNHFLSVLIAFLITGVGTPFLGLIATSMYEGDYSQFFGRLGKIPSFLLITFLMLVIGPMSAAPRAEIITYASIAPFLPTPIHNPLFFSFIFCSVTFVCTYRETKVIDIIGIHITPIKLVCFITLIILSLLAFKHPPQSNVSLHDAVFDSISMGYGTMDLLAAFFFCNIAVRSIRANMDSNNIASDTIKRRTLYACIIGAITLSVIYIGFMFAGLSQASALQSLSADKMLYTISHIILGKYGALFVGICVSFACLATVIALADVTSTYLYYQVFSKKIPRILCLLIVMVAIFIMTNLGFSGIMAIAIPILKIIYPALIILCIVNILYKKYGFPYVKAPFIATIIYCLLYKIYLLYS